MIRMRAAAAVLTLAALVACSPSKQSASSAPIVLPGRPGEETRTITAESASDLSDVRVTADDVQFMQGMLAHHAQALEMTELLRTRTEREDMRRLAERIDISQSDEIRMMRTWLQDRGQPVAGDHVHAHGALMPGMLTPEQMQRLGASRGSAFDRLFLEGMIAHHQGALVMVAELFDKPGAGQDSSVFEFASDVEADQRMEIARMAAMLEELPR